MQFSEDFKETTAISHYWILWLSMMGEFSGSFPSFGTKRKYLHSKQWGNRNGALDLDQQRRGGAPWPHLQHKERNWPTGILSAANTNVPNEITKFSKGTLQVYQPALVIRKAQAPHHVWSTRRQLIGYKNFTGYKRSNYS